MKWSFGHSPLQGEADIAFAAVARELIALVGSELLLCGPMRQRLERMLQDVSKLVLRTNVMVAGIEVAIVLESHRCAAGLGKNAKARELPKAAGTAGSHLRVEPTITKDSALGSFGGS